MPKYNYIAVDHQGRQVTGELEGANNDRVAERIREMGCFPTSIEPAPMEGKPRVVSLRHPAHQRGFLTSGKVKTKDLMAFTRQLSTLIDAGLPLLRGLDVLRKQEINPALNAIVLQIANSIESGSTFSEALVQHPKVFSPLYVNMVRAGEAGGVLHITLSRLADFQEKAQRIKNKVIGAMVYPAVVITVAMAVVAFLMVVIVPRFQEIFRDLMDGKPLPPLTLLVIGVSKLLMQHGLLIVGTGIVMFVAINLIGRTPKGRFCLDGLKLKAPLTGSLMRKASIARFARTLSTLMASGVPILQSLNIVRETVGNAVVADAVNHVHYAVKEGESMALPLAASKVFPALVVSMVEVGEHTGALPDMLTKVADVYDNEVDLAVSAMTAALEPIMIVFLAVVVGTVVIAMFLPLISIISNM